tara:strand:- start:1312 stop:1893 length:582 start_codon:yes stop_codon:yes gene_type:complete
MLQRKSGAIELSMTTLIVVVLSLTLLILGFVFIRSIMCGAIGLTESINDKTDREVAQLFETSGNELVCDGAQESGTLVPGEENHIFCSINAKAQGNDYYITFTNIEPSGGISEREVVNWVTRRTWSENDFPTNDKDPRKTLTVSIPEEASEGNVRVNIDAYKITDTGERVTLGGSKNLDFRVTRSGVVRNILC